MNWRDVFGVLVAAAVFLVVCLSRRESTLGLSQPREAPR